MMAIPPILLVGCGRMGSAMLAGWREQGLAPSVAVDPAPEAAQHASADLTVVADAGAIPAAFTPAAVVLAVKPQSAAEALPPHARFAGTDGRCRLRGHGAAMDGRARGRHGRDA